VLSVLLEVSPYFSMSGGLATAQPLVLSDPDGRRSSMDVAADAVRGDLDLLRYSLG
jgi:hypothetical protein